MSLHVDAACQSVLVFVPQHRAAAAINAILTAHGYAVVTVYSEQDLCEASTLDRLVAVVSLTAHIGTVCRISRLPVVNVEKFVYTEIDQGNSEIQAKRFDSQALIRSLAEAAENRRRPAANIRERSRTVEIAGRANR
jgi:hypothetical protein